MTIIDRNRLHKVVQNKVNPMIKKSLKDSEKLRKFIVNSPNQTNKVLKKICVETEKIINPHAQALGKLSGAKRTKKQMTELAKKRWAGWNESKAQREKEARESAKKAFKELM